MSDKNPSQKSAQSNDETLEPWTKPEIASFEPVAAAQGISYVPGDGLSNLS
jgi:hypothetical protein